MMHDEPKKPGSEANPDKPPVLNYARVQPPRSSRFWHHVRWIMLGVVVIALWAALLFLGLRLLLL